jgi:adenylate cyclase
MSDPGSDRALSDQWRKLLTEGHRPLRLAHRVFRHVPAPPRCKMCHNPFGGIGGRALRFAGFRPSRKNPNLCSRCCDALPVGGADVDIAVLFADVRGSTHVGEHLPSAEFAALLNHFYRVATEVLVRHDAIIDKLIGDEVMALFIPGITGPDYRRRAVGAAHDLLRALAADSATAQLEVGAAVHAGVAYVGNVGGEGVVDFTALGDPINVAARLQQFAAAGSIVLSDEVFDSASASDTGAATQTVDVRGRDGPVRIHTVPA